MTAHDRRALTLLASLLLLGAAVLLLALPNQLEDLGVYRAGGSALLHNHDPYLVHSGRGQLPFTYPPFAVLLATPFAALPRTGAAIALFGLNALAWHTVWHRWLLRAARRAGTASGDHPAARYGRALAGVPPVAAFAAAALLVEPIRSTFAYGQVNLVLMGLVVLDLAVLAPGPGRQRPTTGILTGVAAAIKLTPLVFVGWLLVTRRFRAAATAVASFAAAELLAYAVMPGPSQAYWTTYLSDQRRIGDAFYGSNQSLSGAFARAEHLSAPRGTGLLILTAALGCLGLALAWWIRADRDLSLCVAAVTGLVVSPISWSHHWVWLLPLAVLLVLRSEWLLRAAGCLAALVSLVGLPSWWDRGDDRELHRGVADAFLGETYLIAAVLVLAAIGAVCLLSRRTTRSPSEPPSLHRQLLNQ